MSTRSHPFSHRLRDFFAVDDDWERPGPTVQQRRNDVVIALCLWAVAAVGLEFFRSMSSSQLFAHHPVLQHLLVAAGTLPLIWRRSHPLLVMGLLQLHFFLVGVTVAEVSMSFTMQCVYVFALFSGVAWARSRRAALALCVAVLLLMFGWLAWGYALGSALDDIRESVDHKHPPHGLLPPVTAAILYMLSVNVAYFGGGIVGGQAAWRAARSRAQIEDQAATLAAQADELADRAVVEERLRIARELHDVVAHHVSVMGVQAAAARRVLERRPEAAAGALGQIEESSRQAVGEMRGLLGTLRRTDRTDRAAGTDHSASAGPTGPGEASDPGPAPSSDVPDRAPQPGVDQIPELVSGAQLPGFTVTYAVVEDRPGALADVPMPVGLSLYRTVQEALANVRRHSTAHRATVTLRTGQDSGHGGHSGHAGAAAGRAGHPQRWVEAEVLDEGRPLVGTSGSGLGLLGMRERVASHGGTSEIGPRPTGGYRVRVRFPLATSGQGAVTRVTT